MKLYLKKISIAVLIIVSIFALSIRTKASNNEDKIYCQATLEDNFSNNKVSIILTQQETMNLRNYNISDFLTVKISDIGISQINEITSNLTSIIKEKINNSDEERIDFGTINISEFCRIFELILANEGKENVLKVVRELEKDDRFKYVGVDYINEYETCLAQSNEQILSTTLYENYIQSFELAKIEEAWSISTGSQEVKVGIMDTGVSSSVEHYSSNYDSNLGATFTDDLNDSYNVDEYGHGSYIAGIIGANTSLKVGTENNFVIKDFKGVCPNVKMVSLKIFNNNNAIGGNQYSNYSSIRSLRVASALSYATEKGIKIINSSIGSSQVDSANSLVEQQAIKNYNGLIVTAVGNDGVNVDQNPRYLPSYNFDNIISVGYLSLTGAFPCDNRGNPESNYGKNSVDLFAPGESITSISSDGNIESITGTSFAAPFVTGVAALLLSKYPNLTPLMIKEIIMKTVDKNSSLSELCVSGGRLNAYKALTLNNIQGNGTEMSPYLISNTFEFNCIQALDGQGIYFKQDSNIDFENKQHFLNEYEFKGIYNGNDLLLENISFYRTSLPNKQNIGGIFGINNGTIQYVRIINTNMELVFDTNYIFNIGNLVGSNNGYIFNCQIINGFISTASNNIISGGIAGTNCRPGTIESIENCIVKQTVIYSSGHTGGIVGENEDGIIRNCSLEATNINYSQLTTVNKGIGGIVGFNKDNVVQCSINSTSKVKYSGVATTQNIKPYMGLIIGLNWYPYVEISSCLASGSLDKGNLNVNTGQTENFGSYYNQKIGGDDSNL